MGFIQMSIGAFMSAMVSVFQGNTNLSMVGAMGLCSVGASLIYIFGKRIIVKQASKELVQEEDIEMVGTL
jgi:hypothetical protein